MIKIGRNSVKGTHPMQMKYFVVVMAILIVIVIVARPDATGKALHRLTIAVGDGIASGLKQN